jgi:hypothetical protein
LFLPSVYLLRNIISFCANCTFSEPNIENIIEHRIVGIWPTFRIGIVHLHYEIYALFTVTGKLLVQLVAELWAVDADGGLRLRKHVSPLQHATVVEALLLRHIWFHRKLLFWVILVINVLFFQHFLNTFIYRSLIIPIHFGHKIPTSTSTAISILGYRHTFELHRHLKSKCREVLFALN